MVIRTTFVRLPRSCNLRRLDVNTSCSLHSKSLIKTFSSSSRTSSSSSSPDTLTNNNTNINTNTTNSSSSATLSSSTAPTSSSSSSTSASSSSRTPDSTIASSSSSSSSQGGSFQRPYLPKDRQSAPERARRLFAFHNPTPLTALSAIGHRLPGSAKLQDNEALIEQCLVHSSFWKAVAYEQESYATPSHGLDSTYYSLKSLSDKPLTHFCDNERLDNTLLSMQGRSIVNLLISEHLESTYPYLPNTVMRRAVDQYTSPLTCHEIANIWGIVSGGATSDKPLVHYDDRGKEIKERQPVPKGEKGATTNKTEPQLTKEKIVNDQTPSGLGSLRWMSHPNKKLTYFAQLDLALQSAIFALVGAVHQVHGFNTTRELVRSQFLSRKSDLSTLIKYHDPKRLLAHTLQKYSRERPVSRLLKETGRTSMAPIFIVGVFSGTQKLGEGFGSSLKMADFRAHEDALRRLYLTKNPTLKPSAIAHETFARDFAMPRMPDYDALPTDTLIRPDLAFQPSLIGDDDVQEQSRAKKNTSDYEVKHPRESRHRYLPGTGNIRT